MLVYPGVWQGFIQIKTFGFDSGILQRTQKSTCKQPWYEEARDYVSDVNGENIQFPYIDHRNSLDPDEVLNPFYAF